MNASGTRNTRVQVARNFELPPVRHWQLKLFARYVAFYLRRHFHGLHLLRHADLSSLEGRPLLVCLNHPAWWDPILALYLSQKLFPTRTHYAPIAAAGLSKYRFFEKLGFFGIDPGTHSGASRFLQFGKSVLQSNSGALWVTAEGEFTDVRRRPVQLRAGVGHLARHADRFAVLPVALEYAFWNERSPEAFACLGEPIFISNGALRTADEWLGDFARSLETTQNTLSALVMDRRADAFEPLLTGVAGVGGTYDLWRNLKSLLRGRKFNPEHGSK
jgi:1-acyl-sn-glycerol-3-phosphate acyltransferase